MLPAPAQGALAIEIRKNDLKIEKIANSLKDDNTEIQVEAERGFLDGIEGSCHIPIGAYCQIQGNTIKLTGLYGDEEGKNLIKKSIEGSNESPRELGLELAKIILKEYKENER